MLKERLIHIMLGYEHLLRDLEMVQEMDLPQWWIAAGYVRNYVWDHLHGYPERTPLNDVDVIYFDPNDIREDTEKRYEHQIQKKLDVYHWSFKNQARMHIRNREQPYKSVEDAMKRWPETVTAIGISLNNNQNIEIIAPHGLNDLFDLVVRKSPWFADESYFYTRINNKKWLDQWPDLKVI